MNRKRKDDAEDWFRGGEWSIEDLFSNLDTEFSKMRKQMDGLMRDAVDGNLPENAKKNPFVFGFSVKAGPDGFPVFEDFGNTRMRPFGNQGEKPVVDTRREPLTDINETDDQIAITVELPGVNKEDTDMVPVLTEIAAGSPGALFFPIFQPAGDMVADQAPGVSGLEGTILLGADGLQVQSFMELPQADGMYLSGPDLRYGDNTNQSTGVTAADFLADYEANNGNAPEAPFWAHSYDATTILLEAIKAASHVDGDDLVVDRAGVREYLDNLSGYEGIIGTLSCDDFGDCGAARITVVQNNSADFQGSLENVVFEFAP